MNYICQILGHKWIEVQETKVTWCAKCSRCKKWSYDMNMREFNTFVRTSFFKVRKVFRDITWMIKRRFTKDEPLPF
jgi:hypothetical protein